MIEIWEPKWKEMIVLVSANKIRKGKNYLTYTKVASLKGKVYSFDGESVRSICGTQKVGKGYKIDCYRIPLYMLHEEHDLYYDADAKQTTRVEERTREIGQMVMEELRY